MAENQQRGSSEIFLPEIFLPCFFPKEKCSHSFCRRDLAEGIFDFPSPYGEIVRFPSPYEGIYGSCTRIASEAMADSHVSTRIQKSEEPKEVKELKQEFEDMRFCWQSRSDQEQKQEQMRSPGMQKEFGVQFASNRNVTNYPCVPCVDASDVSTSSREGGEVNAIWPSRGALCPADAVTVLLDRLSVPLHAERCPSHAHENIARNDCVGGLINQYQLGEGVHNTRSYCEAVQVMNGTIKRGILHAIAIGIVTIMLQVHAVGAIAPETARDGSRQAGDSKAATSSFWFSVVASVGILFGILAFFVGLKGYRLTRRNAIVRGATQQRRTMERRSRVQHTIVEEETIHRIEDMA